MKSHNVISKNPYQLPEPLSCGCIVGYFQCSEYQRLHSLENDAYHREDWVAYEEYNRQVWHHIGMKSPFYENNQS